MTAQTHFRIAHSVDNWTHRFHGLLLSLGLALQLGACDGQPAADTAPVRAAAHAITGGELSQGYAAVGLLLTYDGSRVGLCTATLVTESALLTAAHCLNDLGPMQSGALATQVYFHMGLDPTQPNTRRRIERFELHPSYDPSTVTDDLAVAWLDRPVTEVAPMPLSLRAADELVGAEVTLVGYGASTFAQAPESAESSALAARQQTTVMVTEVERSNWYYNVAGNGSGACTGDSGGPALLVDEVGRAVQVGVTSFGDNGCRYFGAYSRLDIHADWLRKLEVLVQPPETVCDADSVCDGACKSDLDCEPYLCPPGLCDADVECTGEWVTAADGQCQYLTERGQVCASLDLVRSQYNRESGRCEYFDRLGTSCLTACPRCNTIFGDCTCPLPQDWPSIKRSF